MDTVNQTLRMRPGLAAHLAATAAELGISRHRLIINTLEGLFSQRIGVSPEVVIGYIKVSGGGLDVDVDCPKCGRALEQPHIGFRVVAARPQAFGPVCALCATQE